MSTQPAIVPYFVYEDATAAIDFLERAFGFETSQRYDGPDGTVIHAEMQFAGGAIMLGTGRDEHSAKTDEQPPAGRGTYCVVEDIESHFERAQAGGAHIVQEPEDTEFGTRRYRVLDPEGYVWSFGTYQPTVS